MLTSYLWSEVGLVNGAPGEINSILYASSAALPNLPIAAIVRFEQYRGPSIFEDRDRDRCVPIAPFSFEWEANGEHYSRTQLPLKLCYALTIHKAQRATLLCAVIDIGSREMTPGLTFVALSRVRRLEGSVYF
jgi:ATP-dependent DNA helicase PIF1